MEEGNNIHAFICVYDSDASSQIKKIIMFESDIGFFPFSLQFLFLWIIKPLSPNIIIDLILNQKTFGI